MKNKKILKEVIKKTSKFLSTLDEIENFNINHNTVYIDLKNKTTAEIKYNDPGIKGVYWSVKDFENRAKIRFDNFLSQDYPEQESWEDHYDRNEFDAALEEMIDNYDADCGISWSTIDAYLDRSCIRDIYRENL